ncbi:hypothetical protein [Crocosphaera sp.]|uniref:hypothetical protein n=1 Tax=Crocosphaera sp. TaxID=2729996 RepID=UPI0026285A9A|nr:hypothetical protein [Crocosphaera sp.]MDJ0583225.1 hypothetical protein [Crocosphaera sp.]
MKNSTRLNYLKDILELLYEKLGEFQKELVMNSNLSAKFELNQRIKREIIPSIRKYEAEYWTLYPQEEIILSDEEAEKKLIEIEPSLISREEKSFNDYQLQSISLLQEIRDKLNENQTASPKLKFAIPLLLPIASYELEIETDGMMYQIWKKLKGILRR